MAEEMPAGRAGDGQRLARARVVEDHGEGAGLPGEDHRAPRDRIEGDVMAAIGQIGEVNRSLPSSDSTATPQLPSLD